MRDAAVWRRLVTVAACAMFTAASFGACAGGSDAAFETSSTTAATTTTTAATTTTTAATTTTTAATTTTTAARSTTTSQATTTSTSSTRPVGSIPQVLVGAWCGGSDTSAHDTWIFAADGTFTADEQVPLSGVAQVRNGGTLVLYTNEIGVHERAIAMDQNTVIGNILYLDGYRGLSH
jgi:hypothetical protein